MKNTIKINGKTYRCRNEKYIPLEIYLDCNVDKNYPHSLRFIDASGSMIMRIINRAFRVYDDGDYAYDLIETPDANEMLKQALKKSEVGVMCWASSGKEAPNKDSSRVLLRRYCETKDIYFGTGKISWQYATPLTKEEILKYCAEEILKEGEL